MTDPHVSASPQFTPEQVDLISRNVTEFIATANAAFTQLANAFIPAAQQIGAQLNALTVPAPQNSGFNLDRFYYMPGNKGRGTWSLRCRDCLENRRKSNHVAYMRNGGDTWFTPSNLLSGTYNAALTHWQEYHA